MTEHEPRRYTRREFGSLLLKTTVGAALGASLPEIKAARGDGGVVTPERPNPCLYAHPEGHPEINLNRPLLRFSVVTFPDQEEGTRFVNTNWNLFLEGIARRVNELQAFYSRYYPNFKAAYELGSRRLSSPLALREYREQEIYGLQVDFPSDFFDKSYNGIKFPVYYQIYITDFPNPSGHPGIGGTFLGNSGLIFMPWRFFFEQYSPPGASGSRILPHEFGHAAFNWDHSSNPGNIMSVRVPRDNDTASLYLDHDRVQNTTGQFGCRNYLPGVFGSPIP